jgi:hypothetical protein
VIPPVPDGAHATCRGGGVEVGGGAVGATIVIVAATLGTGTGAEALEAVGASLRVVVEVSGGATLVSGGGGGGSVGIHGTIGSGAGAGVGAGVGAVAVIVGEMLSHSGEGVMMGTVDGAGMNEGSSTGDSVGTRSGRCMCH